jgi:hypothetical protein
MILLSAIAKGHKEDLVDMDQLVETLSYRPSKESLHFSLRALIKQGFIEKAGLELRRTKKRITFRLLKPGIQVLRGPGADAFIFSVEDDTHLAELEKTIV